VGLAIVKQPGHAGRWRLARSDESGIAVAVLERDVWADRWVAQTLVAPRGDEAIEINAVLDRLNAGVLLHSPGELPFCTRCMRLLRIPPKAIGPGLVECSDCGHVIGASCV
jgi:hypothetical protein